MSQLNDIYGLKFKVSDRNLVENVMYNLISVCRNNEDYFSSKDNSSADKSEFDGLFCKICDLVESSMKTVKKIEKFAGIYDFDEQTPGNGYWSFVFIYEAAMSHTLSVCEDIVKKRDSWRFQRRTHVKEIQVCAQLIESLHQICKNLLLIHDISKNGNLYSDDRSNRNIITNSMNVIDQSCFHGRTSGFQFAESVKPIVRFLDVAMTSYSNYFFTNGSSFAKGINYLIAFTKYSIDPDSCAARFIDATHNGPIDFCKSWWQLGEIKFMQIMPTLFAQSVEVSHAFEIDAVPMRIESKKSEMEIEVELPSSHTGPRGIQVRLICAKRRGNMIGQKSSMNALSDSIIVHSHGGGWTCQSSRSHEFYLRDWAIKLDVPILSIDYSLAPENPYPRALEEIFYTYCWVLKNGSLLGTTGKKIIFAGDSAGGNLNAACVVEIIERGIQKPHGMLAMFSPFYLNFCSTPAKYLTFVDPLLPFGFIMRVFKYYGSTEAIEELNNPKMSEKSCCKLSYLFSDWINLNKSIIPPATDDELIFNVPENPYLSPYRAEDEILRQFPQTKILSMISDPCLDDCVEFSKKLRRLDVTVSLDILNGINHGFLNFTKLSIDCHRASMYCADLVAQLIMSK